MAKARKAKKRRKGKKKGDGAVWNHSSMQVRGKGGGEVPKNSTFPPPFYCISDRFIVKLK